MPNIVAKDLVMDDETNAKHEDDEGGNPCSQFRKVQLRKVCSSRLVCKGNQRRYRAVRL